MGASGDPGPVIQHLEHAYAQPHRVYHTLAHIRSCLAQFDSGRHLAEEPGEVELAIWFHDVVYDPRAGDNESRSADDAARILGQAGITHQAMTRIRGLILATRHDSEPAALDSRLMVDVDLSIFGGSQAVFDRYEAQIRQEYVWVPETEFRRKRARLLESFLSRRAIFQTDFFNARYEAQARANLARSIRQLLS
jgi:predicted metal-dependent HD superfamily phosphohydrolase